MCIDRIFSDVTNFDEDERLLWCFNNWAGITTTDATPTTTPAGCRNVYKSFEVFVIIFVGFLVNFLK
jgi:hypothetical protein